MPKVYGSAEDVEEIAQRLIPSYHPELATAEFQYYFVNQSGKKNGLPVLGKSRKIAGGPLEYLTGKQFLVEVALDQWNQATEQQRAALVDHLLECCTGEENEEDGSMKWSMRQPDVNEFTSILSRHGAWHEALEGMVEVAHRLNIEARVQEVNHEASEVFQGEV